MNVKLTKEQKIQVLNEQDVVGIMQQILKRESKIDRNKEHFWIICLGNSNHILLIELVSLGTVNATLVEPMEIFSFALQKRAVKLILVHNHPSGVTDPSDTDYKETERMVAIGKFINMPVIDHIIITENSHFSFVQGGLMDRIEKTSNIDLTFAKQTAAQKDVARLQEIIEVNRLQAELALQKAEKKLLLQQKETALQAIAEGLNIDLVVKLSGLTIKEVEKLVKK